MSKRVLAPLVLLLAAACALAAVFAVQRIERRGGPLSEPFATTYFSPGTAGALDEAVIRFRTRQTEGITIVVRDDDGDTVRTVVRNERMGAGTHREVWDGTDDDGAVVDDGMYHVVITRAGDDREYAPARPTVVDTVPPRAVLDGAMVDARRLLGLVFADPGVRIEATPRDGGPYRPVTYVRPVSDKQRTAQFIDPPRGSEPLRFNIRLGADLAPLDLRIFVVDQAGNRTELTLDDIDGALLRVEAAGGTP